MIALLRAGASNARVRKLYGLTVGQVSGFRTRYCAPPRRPGNPGSGAPRRPGGPADRRDGLPAPQPLPPVPAGDGSVAAAVLALGPHDCRWPLGEVRRSGFRFCGGRQVGRSSYCAFHRRASVHPADEQAGRAR